MLKIESSLTEIVTATSPIDIAAGLMVAQTTDTQFSHFQTGENPLNTLTSGMQAAWNAGLDAQNPREPGTTPRTTQEFNN